MLITRQRPSRLRSMLPHLIWAAALLLCTTGSVVAATQITSKQIRNSTIRGIDVKRSTITGREVAEPKLGIVPNAARLGGVAAAGYARSSTVQQASANALAVPAATILTFSDINLSITTDGTADADTDVKIDYTAEPGASGEEGLSRMLHGNGTLSICFRNSGCSTPIAPAISGEPNVIELVEYHDGVMTHISVTCIRVNLAGAGVSCIAVRAPGSVA